MYSVIGWILKECKSKRKFYNHFSKALRKLQQKKISDSNYYFFSKTNDIQLVKSNFMF